ncbi:MULTISPECIES: helix-turn-helix domain-containing protein [unclassified Haladaptatus]|uniref:helix-turn-helix domain-containing protein n=1 Tax=unclassified Haladaptatus TaxID=2622732 RepID=UPI00209BCB68|nr:MULTISPECIES: helix-turn-helix domain-containing protein [unclassified Haladaptatus]MCO8244940.1 helix-turn-helix domain-containing protein [Haladaptatus sp. AB643]MCO8255547.1 helix-turn-helix domain-containing protein [Haladaptatus sp. AB618]
MSTIADITLPGNSFPLGQLLTDNPKIHIEIERLVPLGDRVLPFFWVNDSSPEIRSTLENQSIVESVEHLSTVDDRDLYQVTWSDVVNGVIDALIDTNAAILEGQGLAGQWELRLRFPDHDHLQQFSRICEENDIEVTLNSIYNPHVPNVEEQLTQTQRQTLAMAYELGYFTVPRESTLTELADHFDISEQAASQRIRRAINVVIRHLVFDES